MRLDLNGRSRRLAAVGSLLTVGFFAASCREVPTATEGENQGEGVAAAAAARACTLAADTDYLLTLLSSIAAEVSQIGESGRLNTDQVRALLEHLENIGRHIRQDRSCPALTARDAFHKLVMNYRRVGFLGDRDVAELLSPMRLLEPAPPQPEGTPESYVPGVTGELRSVEVDGTVIQYEVIDGLAIYQSDIILGYADEFEASIAAGAVPPEVDIAMSGICRIPGDAIRCGVWADGVMGFDFAIAGWGGETVRMRNLILDAIAHWESRAGVAFEHRTSGQRVVFRNASGCSSSLGRKDLTGFTPQWINLATDCDQLGVIIHEIGHAVGLFHEQARRDRDGFVRIFPARIEDGKSHNFDRYGSEGLDVGPYDYGSIMHYPCTSFAIPDAGNTLEPTQPGVTCADIGQRNGLSDGDILGAFGLYPPRYEIAGASPSETRDRFDLRVVATRLSLPRPEHVVWTSHRVPGTLATGHTLSTLAAGLAPGAHVITASITIRGVTIATRSIAINIFNNAPVVTLGPDRLEHLNVPFGVVPAVSDVEDVPCSPPVCTYTWSPAPQADLGSRAVYRFTTVGPQTITLTVRDGGGSEASASVNVNVVNTPPQPVILTPAAGSGFSTGSTLSVNGYADDINEPGGRLACTRITWSSSDPSDSFDTTVGCTPTLTFGAPGLRALTVTVSDPQSASVSAVVAVDVIACGTSCRPDVSFVIVTDPELDGSLYTPPFTGPGYLLTTAISMQGFISDPDVPPDNPIQFAWHLVPPCPTPGITPCPSAIEIGSGAVVQAGFPARADLTFRAADHVAEWTNCAVVAREYTIRLSVRDATGEFNSYSRPVHLACTLI